MGGGGGGGGWAWVFWGGGGGRREGCFCELFKSLYTKANNTQSEQWFILRQIILVLAPRCVEYGLPSHYQLSQQLPAASA